MKEKEFIDILIASEGVYDAVVAQLDIPKDDELYRNLVVGILKRQTRNHLVFSIWNNMDDAQLEHLREFMNETAVIVPEVGYEEILMQFALMYPDLMEKIHKSLADFFRGFIEKFNEISRA
ncbi:MAG: hypothetical protein ABIH78_03250 [Candidatus Peregrinibacteria bacterium]